MRQIEERAAAVLTAVPEWLWNGERVPVPVEDIADSWFGLLVRDVDDMGAAPGAPELDGGQSLSGLLLPSRGEIWVNAGEAREWPPRRRFTIGHELGHWVMHAQTSHGQQALFCRSTSIAPEEQLELEVEAASAPRPARSQAEEEADVFAAALLMPAPLVRAVHTACGGDREVMCERFGCSNKAMERRLLALEL